MIKYTFDPKDPPDFIRCWGFMKLGREYLLTTQELDIYGTAEAYEGPVRILHGTRDGIVGAFLIDSEFLDELEDGAGLVRPGRTDGKCFHFSRYSGIQK